MSFKPLFSKSLAAAPERLHFAAHSHHLWPDASFDGQVACWNDAGALADRKWDKIMGEVWPEAQRHVADELGTAMPDSIIFASNTHEFLVRLVLACPRASTKLRILTSDGEFHSARRQLARWEEEGSVAVERVPVEPAATFDDRFLEAAEAGGHDLVLVSQVMFGSGTVFGAVDRLSALGQPAGPWIVIDGYHAFMALEQPFGSAAGRSAFYLGGGYKYAMSGEGCAFLSAPPAFGPRPPITGWFAEFEDLTLPPGSVGYRPDAMRFMGATFDPSGLYRFNAVRRMLRDNGLSTPVISAHVADLQRHLVEATSQTALRTAELLNPPTERDHARFLAFRRPRATEWHRELMDRGCVTDVRGDVIRIGLAIYHDQEDVDRFAGLAAELSA